MTSHEGTSVTRPPLFDGMNFSFWKVRMRTYLMALGADVWDVVETGYIKPVVLASKDDKLEFSFNAKGMNAILNGLAEAEFVKVMHLQTAKEMWDKLINNYEGNEKVKDAKLQTYRVQFEKLQMKEDETIGKYFLRVEELVNAMKALGEEIEEPSLVQKILRSLPDRFNPKVSAIEELNDIKTLSFDQLLGTLTAYEMRIVTDKTTSREASFKADKNEDCEPDEIEAKFVRRLKKGSGKYQGKLPFKCFNCGKIGHFANKCPHKKHDQNSEDEEKHKSRRFDKKKSLCVNNDDSSEDTDSDSSCEDKVNDFSLMAKEDGDNESKVSDENDEEVVVDMEGELISALEEIDRLRIKNRKQKQLLIQFEKDSKQPDEDFALLKVELEEARKIEDILKHQLSEKRARSEALEEEVVKTRKEMEKFQALYHQNLSSIKASEGLATILSQQRNPKLKTGLGYEEGSSSGQPRNKEPIKFVKANVHVKPTTNDNNKPAETKEDNQPPRTSKGKSARTESVEQRNNALPAQGHHQHERNRFAQRRQPFSRYKELFYGYCFYCSNFGHKAVNCSFRLRHEHLSFPRNKYLPQQRMIQQSKKPSQIANCQIKSRDMQLRRSINNKQSMSRQRCNNNFDLLNNEIECYNCHNFGHKAASCNLKDYKADPRIKFLDKKASTWKRKDIEKCDLALSIQKQKAPGNIESGCCKHLTGDMDKLMCISKRKTENVILGNDEPGKIKDRGMVSLSNDKGDAQYVLLVDSLKHNSLSSSQKCDRGSEEVLTSKECKVNVNSGQMVNNSIRENNNVDVESSPASKEEDSDTIKECSVNIYPMKEVGEEPCHKQEAKVLKVEKADTQIKFLSRSMTLDKVLDSQRSPNDKSDIGLNKVEISAPKKPDIGPSFVRKKSRHESGCSSFLL
jgi:hypothetical protein